MYVRIHYTSVNDRQRVWTGVVYVFVCNYIPQWERPGTVRAEHQ